MTTAFWIIVALLSLLCAAVVYAACVVAGRGDGE